MASRSVVVVAAVAAACDAVASVVAVDAPCDAAAVVARTFFSSRCRCW